MENNKQIINDESNNEDNLREIDRIKRKFNITNVDENDEIISSKIKEENEITNSSIIIKENTKFKKILPSQTKLKRINFSTSKQRKQMDESDEILMGSTKYSVNAIINMIHKNYENIVDRGEKEEDIKSEKTSVISMKKLMAENRNSYNFIKNCYSINDIKSNISLSEISSNKIIKISENKLFSIKDYSMYIILQFLYERFNVIMESHSLLTNKINSSLHNLFINTINSFKETYQNIFILSDYYFKYSQFKKGRFIFPLLDLVFKCKICKNKSIIPINNSISFSYTFKVIDKSYNIKEYYEEIKFDLRNKNDGIFWISSDIDEYKGSTKRLCYTLPILLFTYDDYFIFKLNIFSVNGRVDPYSIQWKNLNIEALPSSDYFYFEKQLTKRKCIYDPLRTCELEMTIHYWKPCDNLNNKEIFNEIIDIYKYNFDILESKYDIFNLIAFRFKLRANKEGIITKNKYIEYDIVINRENESICNQCHSLRELNVNNIDYKICIRKGDILMLYINDYYK